jgi:hypothetical protein
MIPNKHLLLRKYGKPAITIAVIAALSGYLFYPVRPLNNVEKQLVGKWQFDIKYPNGMRYCYIFQKDRTMKGVVIESQKAPVELLNGSWKIQNQRLTISPRGIGASYNLLEKILGIAANDSPYQPQEMVSFTENQLVLRTSKKSGAILYRINSP